MNLHSAVRLSAIDVAVRRSLVEAADILDRKKRQRCERELRSWEAPAVAAMNLVRFDAMTGAAVFRTRVYNQDGAAIALALAVRQAHDDWEPLDPSDTITVLGDLTRREEIEIRQRRVITRKRELDVPEGAEWKASAKFSALLDQRGKTRA